MRRYFVIINFLCCLVVQPANASPFKEIFPENRFQVGILWNEPDTLPEKRDATAQSNLQFNNLTPVTYLSMSQLLQGALPGLMIRHYSGQPGNFDLDMSIWGNNTPLLVIDGVICHDISTLNRINPYDIKTVKVLKNNAAVIYGNRGTNGAIEVTTKKGNGKPVFNVHSSVGVQNPVAIPRMTDAFQYAEMVNRARRFQQLEPAYDSVALDAYKKGLPGYEGTDWFGEIFRKNALLQSHSLTVSGGRKWVDYFASIGFKEDEGILKSRDIGYEQYHFRTNLTVRPLRGLEARLLIDGVQDRAYEPSAGFTRAYHSAMYANPTTEVYANGNQDQLLVVEPLYENPIVYSDAGISGQSENTGKNLRITGSLSYEIPFVSGLVLEGRYATSRSQKSQEGADLDYYLYWYDEASDEYIGMSSFAPRLNSGSQDYLQDTYRLQVNYQKLSPGQHRLEAGLGIEDDTYDFDMQSLSVGYSEEQGNMVIQDTLLRSGLSHHESNRSVYGYLEYAFLDRYTIESAYRMNKYPLQPAQGEWQHSYMGALAWTISNEKFFQNAFRVFSTARLYVSYGKTVGWSRNQLYFDDFFSINPTVTSRNSEIGIETGYWNDQLQINMVHFKKIRDGIVPLIVLASESEDDAGDTDQISDLLRGFEVEAIFRKTLGELKFNLGMNLTYVRNMLLEFFDNPYQDSYDRWRNGNSYRYADIVWGYAIEGQFQDKDEVLMAPPQNYRNGNSPELPGDYKYEDLNGDGVINTWDMKPMFMNETPKLFYGLAFQMQWRKFDLSLSMQGAAKYTRNLYEGYKLFEYYTGNVPATYYDAWTQEDDNSIQPGRWPATRYLSDVGAMYLSSRIWNRNANYLRLKNINIGYTMTASWLNTLRISKIRVYASGHNLFTIADALINEIGPERKDLYAYPLMKSLNIGIDVSFE